MVPKGLEVEVEWENKAVVDAMQAQSHALSNGTAINPDTVSFEAEQQWGAVRAMAGVPLQAGFRAELKRRTEGATAGTTDKYYHAPSGRKCR